jgi:hypothetical protein
MASKRISQMVSKLDSGAVKYGWSPTNLVWEGKNKWGKSNQDTLKSFVKTTEHQKRRYPGGQDYGAKLPRNYREFDKQDKNCGSCYFQQNFICERYKEDIKIAYVCDSWKNPESNQNTIVLEKSVYRNLSGIRELINVDFQEFGQPNISKDIDLFFRMYDEVFYDLPKLGVEGSHTYMLERAKDHLEDYTDPKDQMIDALLMQVSGLQETIQDQLSSQPHPFFPDGTLLHVPYVQSGIMQGGKLRMMAWSVTKIFMASNPAWKDADGNTKSIRKIATIFNDTTVMDGIPKGKSILKEEDLNDYTYEIKPSITSFIDLVASIQRMNINDAEAVQLISLIKPELLQ